MLDVKAIVSGKIQSMEESPEFQAYLEKKTEEMINSSIERAFSSWNVGGELEKRITKSVSEVLNSIDFTAYNGFIASKVKEIVESVLAKDAADKVQEVFESMFVKKYESIELSKIITVYRNELIDCLSDDEKHDLYNEFYVSFIEDGCFITINLAPQEDDMGYADSFRIRLYRDFENESVGKISSARIGGDDVEGKLRFYGYREFERLLMNLYYNKTEIIIDVNSEHQVDNSLDLDI